MANTALTFQAFLYLNLALVSLLVISVLHKCYCDQDIIIAGARHVPVMVVYIYHGSHEGTRLLQSNCSYTSIIIVATVSQYWDG